MGPIRSGRIIPSEFNNVSLKDAPFTFLEKLEETLGAHDHYAVNGWKAIATQQDLHVPIEKLEEIEQTKNPVHHFLHYLIFEHPRRDELTVERMEEIAMGTRNQQIVKEFTALKKELKEYGANGIPTAEDVYLHYKPPFPVFNMLPYRMVRIAGEWTWVHPFLMVCFLCQLVYSVWLTLSIERKFLSPPALEIKVWIVTMVRVCIRFLAPIIFTCVLLVCKIANVPKELSHHKILYILAGHPKYLLILHKEHVLKGEQAALEKSKHTNMIQHTLDTLYCPLKWSTLAVIVFSIFISLFLYKADGMNHEHLLHKNLTSTEDMTYNIIWDGFSLFTALFIVGITYALFIYEQRLIHYAGSLISKGDSQDIKEAAKDMQQKLAERWKLVEICSIPATVFLTFMVFLQYALGIPLTASCMPFPVDFTPTQWVCCISCLVIPSVLTFMNVENGLRVGKRAVCIICLLLMIAHRSWLQKFVGSESHLHILLYLIPLIILFWISWTFFRSHLTTSRHQGSRSKYSILHASMAAMSLCTICLSFCSEYSYINNSQTQLHQNTTCKHLLPEPPTSNVSNPALQNLNFTEDDCQSIAPPETDSEDPIAVSPALPQYCYFYGGLYQFRFHRLLLTSHFIQVDLSYHVISYHLPQHIHVRCMCPSSGHFTVIFKTIDFSTMLTSDQCSSDFRLTFRQSWRTVFSLIANMCIGPRPS